jgi:hypothetical protein
VLKGEEAVLLLEARQKCTKVRVYICSLTHKPEGWYYLCLYCLAYALSMQVLCIYKKRKSKILQDTAESATEVTSITHVFEDTENWSDTLEGWMHPHLGSYIKYHLYYGDLYGIWESSTNWSRDYRI